MGEREGEGLVGRPRRQACGFEEAPALIGGEVLAAAGVDEVEIADQSRYFALRSVCRGSSTRPHRNVQELRIRRDRGLQGSAADRK